MRLHALVIGTLGLLVGCMNQGDPDVKVERQPTTIEDASPSAWDTGGAVLVAQPGSFAFPQPLSLRISIVDADALDAEGHPTPLSITSASIGAYNGSSPFELVSAPTCAANTCTAELRITAAGESMITVDAIGPEGTQHDCFYYAMREDADPQTAGNTLREQLEAQQKECVHSLVVN